MILPWRTSGFAGNIAAASEFAGSIPAILAGIAAMLGFGWWLYAAKHRGTATP